MPGNFRWTMAELWLLQEMVQDGSTDAEIAAELNRVHSRYRTERSVRARRANTGTPGNPRGAAPNTVARSRLVGLLIAGHNINQIAKLTKRNSSTIMRMVQRMVREGVLRREGGKTRTVRYAPTRLWFLSDDDPSED